MQRITHSTLVRLLLGLSVLIFLALASSTWAAPQDQGTVPTPPRTPTSQASATLPLSVTPTPATPSVTPTPTATPFGPFTGVCCLPGIAFNSNRDGNQEIYIMRADGTGVTRLTDNPAADIHPSASPNALSIIFESNRDDPDPQHCGTPGFPNCIFHLYLMNVDGTGVTRLTDGPYADESAAWSYDSSRIAFDSTRADPDPLHCGQPNRPNCIRHIYVMNPDGSAVTDLMPNALATPPAAAPGPVTAASFHPNWSPDDQRIVFVSDRDDPHPDTCGQPGQPACVTQIYVMSFDGAGQTRLTDDGSQDGHPAWSADQERIVFHSNQSGHFQIYVMNADGSNPTRITNDSGDDVNPIWDPGCNDRIVFASNRDGGRFRIFSMNSDGSDQARLTTLPPDSTADDDNPDWSGLPLALRTLPGPCCVPAIAFHSLRDGQAEIYLMKADGSFLTRLTYNPAADMHPAPSFNGRRIAFEANRDDPHWETCGQPGQPNCIFHLFSMLADGSHVTPLTDGITADRDAAWSPDGTRIAFDSTRDDPNPLYCGQPGKAACLVNIYVMNADGSGLVRLTESAPANPFANSHPNWSPDGQALAFVSNRDGNDEIYTMHADGADQTRLTNNPASDGHPSWSPDGQQIVFESNRDGHFQIYIMKADGSNPTRLTDDQGDDRHPYFCPSCTNRIVFASNRDGVNFSIYVMNADGSDQVRLTVQPAGSSAPDDMPAWSGLPIALPVPIPLPPLAIAAAATVIPPPSPFATVTAPRPAPSATLLPPSVPTQTPTALPAFDFVSRYFVDTIHGPRDFLASSVATVTTNILLAALMAFLFGFFGILVYDTFEEHEQDLQTWLGPLRNLLRAGQRGQERFAELLARYRLGWVGDLLQILLALSLFGLLYSLLDPDFSFDHPDVFAFIFGVALSIGLVNLFDDISKLLYLRRQGAKAVVRVHNANFVVAALMVLVSRVGSLQPGILAVGPGGLEGEEKGDRFLLNLFGLLGYVIPGLVAWLLLLLFPLASARGLTLLIATILSLIFAIGLQTAFFEMIPIPGLYGEAIYHRNRGLWFLMITFFGFMFIQTQLNPDGEFLAAFKKQNVVALGLFVLAFCLFSAGIWYYFRRAGRPGEDS